MITELLIKTINEVETSRFTISEFQLGKEPYELLKLEVESAISGVTFDIHKVNTFSGIPVKIHPCDNAVMYALQLKSNE